MTLLNELRNLKTQQPFTKLHADGDVQLLYQLPGSPSLRLLVQFEASGLMPPSALLLVGYDEEIDPDWWRSLDTWHQATVALYSIVRAEQALFPPSTFRELATMVDVDTILGEFRDHLASLGWLVTLIREMGS